MSDKAELLIEVERSLSQCENNLAECDDLKFKACGSLGAYSKALECRTKTLNDKVSLLNLKSELLNERRFEIT